MELNVCVGYYGHSSLTGSFGLNLAKFKVVSAKEVKLFVTRMCSIKILHNDEFHSLGNVVFLGFAGFLF